MVPRRPQDDPKIFQDDPRMIPIRPQNDPKTVSRRPHEAPRMITDDDFWPSIKASTEVESMLIWGEDDTTFVSAFIDQLPNYAKDLRIEVLPGVRHWPPLEAPDKVNHLIREFIEAP